MNFLCEYNLPLNMSDDHGISLENDLMCESGWIFYKTICISMKSSASNRSFDSPKNIST